MFDDQNTNPIPTTSTPVPEPASPPVSSPFDNLVAPITTPTEPTATPVPDPALTPAPVADEPVLPETPVVPVTPVVPTTPPIAEPDMPAAPVADEPLLPETPVVPVVTPVVEPETPVSSPTPTAFPEPPAVEPEVPVVAPPPTFSPPVATTPTPVVNQPINTMFEGKGAGKYKVVVIKDKCIGAASCVAVAPKAFKLNDQQIAEVLPTISQETDENLLLAAQSCPTMAIEVYDTETGEKVWPK